MTLDGSEATEAASVRVIAIVISSNSPCLLACTTAQNTNAVWYRLKLLLLWWQKHRCRIRLDWINGSSAASDFKEKFDMDKYRSVKAWSKVNTGEVRTAGFLPWMQKSKEYIPNCRGIQTSVGCCLIPRFFKNCLRLFWARILGCHTNCAASILYSCSIFK
jgi:hypothetical protein